MATGQFTEAELQSLSQFIQLADNTDAASSEAAEGHEAEEHSEAQADDAHAGDDKTEMIGHTEVHDGATGMPQLDTSTYSNQIFWLVLCLIAVYFLFSRIALPRIGGTIEQRAQAIQRDLDRAAEMKGKAEEAEAQYHQALADARSRAHEIAEKTKAEIQADVDAATAKADAEIAKQSSASAKRIAKLQSEAEGSVEDVAKDVTKAILDALAPAASDDKAIAGAISKVLKG